MRASLVLGIVLLGMAIGPLPFAWRDQNVADREFVKALNSISSSQDIQELVKKVEQAILDFQVASPSGSPVALKVQQDLDSFERPSRYPTIEGPRAYLTPGSIDAFINLTKRYIASMSMRPFIFQSLRSDSSLLVLLLLALVLVGVPLARLALLR
jgi:hypothetical protein